MFGRVSVQGLPDVGKFLKERIHKEGRCDHVHLPLEFIEDEPFGPHDHFRRERVALAVERLVIFGRLLAAVAGRMRLHLNRGHVFDIALFELHGESLARACCEDEEPRRL